MGEQGTRASRRGRRAALAGIAAGLLLALTPSPSLAVGTCDTGVAHDYSAPFAAKPPLRPLPPSSGLPFGEAPRQLPFGPRGVYLRRRDQDPLMLTDTSDSLPIPPVTRVGYRLDIPSGGKWANPELPRLGWTVTATLSRVTPARLVRRVLGDVTRRVTGPGANEGATLIFPFEREPGLYALMIVFRNRAGEPLGRFGEYFRVLAPVANARLTLNGTVFRPGETVAACLENLGTTSHRYGACGMGIEEYDAGGYAWKAASFDSEPHICTMQAIVLGAGASVLLNGFTLPADAPPGQYRVSHYGLTAPFQIVPPG